MVREQGLSDTHLFFKLPLVITLKPSCTGRHLVSSEETAEVPLQSVVLTWLSEVLDTMLVYE